MGQAGSQAYRRRAVLGLLIAGTVAISLAAGPVRSLAEGAVPGWVIDAARARRLLGQGAVLFDARPVWRRIALPVAGAVPVDWQAFTQSEPTRRGNLLADDAALGAQLSALGLRAARPVVVIGDAQAGRGEDGRLVWMLRTLGHEAAFLVNGGAQALRDAGPLVVAPPGRGDFVVRRTDAYSVTRDELRADLGRGDLVILDARAPREYAGETPYGESRGGHVPGARSLYFRDLIGADGRVLQGDALAARLGALGVGPETPVIAYCSGGIRSGFVTTVLRGAGIDARNYAGSMWEWSAAPAADYPLVSE